MIIENKNFSKPWRTMNPNGPGAAEINQESYDYIKYLLDAGIKPDQVIINGYTYACYYFQTKPGVKLFHFLDDFYEYEAKIKAHST